MVNISNWKEFNLKDIFKISGIKRIEKPKDISKIKNSFFSVALISQTSINNQIEGYIHSNLFDDFHCLTCDSLSSGFCFYQKDKFLAIKNQFNCKLKLLYKNINKYQYLFIVTILNKQSKFYNYSYQRSVTRLLNEKIKLPSIEKEDGTFEPDWQYMENYIKEKGE